MGTNRDGGASRYSQKGNYVNMVNMQKLWMYVKWKYGKPKTGTLDIYLTEFKNACRMEQEHTSRLEQWKYEDGKTLTSKDGH